MGIKKQYYGLKFPFTANNENGIYLDLNSTFHEKIGSEIAHVILTPKGTRIRMPEFGTDLIKFLFEYNDEMSWEDIKEEIKTNVSKYVPNAIIENIEVITREENDNALFIDVKYGVKKGKSIENNRMFIKL